MIEKTNEEGPRGFAVLLQQVDDGALHGELSETLQNLCGELSDHATNFGCIAKGAVTLTISLAASPNGTILVLGDVKSKSPKLPRAGSVFWLTKGNNLTPENPRQQSLQLREVPLSQSVRDVPTNEAQPARSV